MILRDWFEWTGCTGRGRFALVFLVVTGLTLSLGAFDPLGPAMMVAPLFLAVCIYVAIVQTRRRLRDMNWPGGLVWLTTIPVIAVFFAAVLAIKRSAPAPRAMPSGWTLRAGQIVAVLFCLFIASRALWAPYWSPSGSMKPTLLIGDYYAVSRASGAPEIGTLVVFAHPVNGTHYVKRVIAGPGDIVQMQGGRVVLNGTPLPQAVSGTFVDTFERQGPQGVFPACQGAAAPGALCEKTRLIETHPTGRQYAILDIGARPSDDTAELVVPEGHFFALGDNRDNSLDSRMPQIVGGVGFVPFENVKGRVTRVLFNFDGQPGRFLQVVR